ncbi:ricin-type beta-trefoil lectin domain protein [Streptomyces sp. NPDC005283]|uniref:ricin-type beta-trefoil lectin domain protein n=1 Tax=Streptomyces sp. NPDC005283 TaxID=3156871 RepID=UPI0034531CAF
MQNPRTPGPVPPTHTGLSSGDSDEGLAATLRAGGGKDEARPVAVLLARHWQPVVDYASICTPSAKAASMLAAAAFSKVLENLRKARSTAALRPLLLLTARQIAKGWANDRHVVALPELQYPDGGRTLRVDMFTLPENRELVSRAFHAMPGPVQCLLWHAEVEAEGISVPAGLLAIDPRTAGVQLEQARELFRAGCLRAHVELAPDKDCRHYSRLLDVSLRRGGTLIPDIQKHLAECQYCRYAAEQLNHLDGRLAVLLAEAVLGQAARGYLESRPARNGARAQAKAQGGEGPVRSTGRHSKAGRPRALPRMTFPGRHLMLARPKVVLTGLGLLVTGALVVTAVSALWSEDSDYAGPSVPSGSVTDTAPPASGSQVPSGRSPQPSTTSAGLPAGLLTTRLRNADAGLCLDIRDRRAVRGAEAVMAVCSSTVTQTWAYEDDGLLRSFAAPDLCLNSHELDGVAVLDACAAASAANAADVRYDLTIQGNVIPRWNDGLALVPVSPDPATTVVVKVRDGSAAQRWVTDNVAADTRRIRPSADVGSPSTKEVNASPQTGEYCASPSCQGPPPPAGGAEAPVRVPSDPDAEQPRTGVRRVSNGSSDEKRVDRPVRKALGLHPAHGRRPAPVGLRLPDRAGAARPDLARPGHGRTEAARTEAGRTEAGHAEAGREETGHAAG